MKDINIKQKPLLSLHSLGGGSNGILLGSSGGENYWFSLFGKSSSSGTMNSFTAADSDAQGNVYAVGYSDRHTGVQFYGTYYGDLLIVKWNKDGEYQWQQTHFRYKQ